MTSVSSESTASKLLQTLVTFGTSQVFCVSKPSPRHRETLTLPAELLDWVVDCLIAELEESEESRKDGRVLCKLMHVSCSTRRRVVQAFEPVELHFAQELPEVSLPEEGRIASVFCERLRHMMRRYITLDFSEWREKQAISDDKDGRLDRAIATRVGCSGITAIIPRISRLVRLS